MCRCMNERGGEWVSEWVSEWESWKSSKWLESLDKKRNQRISGSLSWWSNFVRIHKSTLFRKHRSGVDIFVTILLYRWRGHGQCTKKRSCDTYVLCTLHIVFCPLHSLHFSIQFHWKPRIFYGCSSHRHSITTGHWAFLSKNYALSPLRRPPCLSSFMNNRDL